MKNKDSEKIFLEGPRSRVREFIFSLKVLLEFIRGFRALHFMGPCIAVFGSARLDKNSPYYDDARKLSAGLADLGFAIITGGGPGIMEAANRGAKEHHSLSAGCNILLPKEQKPNSFMDKWFVCDYFFVRKVLIFKYSSAFVIMPGGIGTLNEFFEALTLIQTHKIIDFPIVVFGKSYWRPLIPLFNAMMEAKTISSDDLKYVLFTDSIEDALAHIKKGGIEKYEENRKRYFRKPSFLGE